MFVANWEVTVAAECRRDIWWGELNQVLALRNQTNVSFLFFFDNFIALFKKKKLLLKVRKNYNLFLNFFECDVVGV